VHKGDSIFTNNNDDDDDDDDNNNNNNNNTCTPIDVATPAHRNVVQKEAEKKLKHNSLCTEIELMWN
jgi:hypothetical protein